MFDSYIKKAMELERAKKEVDEATKQMKELEAEVYRLGKAAVTAFNSSNPSKMEYHTSYYMQLDRVVYEFRHSENYYSINPVKIIDVSK